MWRFVANKGRRFGSARGYWNVRGPHGDHLLLTREEVARGVLRAKANPEDVPPTGLARPWWGFMSWFGRVRL
jgi:hypothetical protein